MCVAKLLIPHFGSFTRDQKFRQPGEGLLVKRQPLEWEKYNKVGFG